ncbi:MAG: TatD family nuclease-associated radical SAM protein [Clostridia bacterium]|nr:TatD family nuclease-associated radical SAM protein [Clostridia bacterium]
MTNNYVYELGNNLYINLTNRCPNSCEFCVRNIKKEINGNDLWLLKEPTMQELEEDLSMYPLSKYEEIVFCGYGEPTYCLSMISQAGPFLKRKGARVRLNTNGLGNLINKRNDVPELLSKYVDCVSVSMNASDPEVYQEICRSRYGQDAFYAMLDFLKGCVNAGIDTTATVVDFIGEEEIEKCRELALSCGAKFRVRPTIYDDTEY